MNRGLDIRTCRKRTYKNVSHVNRLCAFHGSSLATFAFGIIGGGILALALGSFGIVLGCHREEDVLIIMISWPLFGLD